MTLGIPEIAAAARTNQELREINVLANVQQASEDLLKERGRKQELASLDARRRRSGTLLTTGAGVVEEDSLLLGTNKGV